VTGNDTCCSNVTQSEPHDVDPECATRYKVTRTWRVTDDCGNTHAESQVITVDDSTTDPMLVGVPEEDGLMLYECDGLPVTLPNVTATDNCDEGLAVMTSEPTRTNLSATCPFNVQLPDRVHVHGHRRG